MALNLKKLASPLLAASLLLPSVNAFAQVAADPFNGDKPTAIEMYTDLFLMRPIGIVQTVLGSAVYVVALPFTLASGGATEAGEVLVVRPAMYTFVRCLGCTRPGYNRSESATQKEEEAVEPETVAE